MKEDALTCRLQRGLDQQDEQMGLLIQRVSGSYRNSYFFPDLAGALGKLLARRVHTRQDSSICNEKIMTCQWSVASG